MNSPSIEPRISQAATNERDPVQTPVKPAYTPGPWRDIAESISHLNKNGHWQPIKLYSPWVESAWDGDKEARGNAQFAIAACNAFDSAARKLGVNALGLAESMADGSIAGLAESLQDVLGRFRSCIGGGNGEIEGDIEAILKAEAVLAAVEGEVA